jgi:MoxR-like ATPase
VLPEDMVDLVHDVLRHRVVLSYEAVAENMTTDAVIAKLMTKIAPPTRALRSKDEELKAA